MTSLKQLVAKQITDNEKIILSGISPKYSIDNIDKGNFIIKEFQDDLAMNTARFKGYTPDARIVAHLRTRAKEFNVDVPIFLRKKQQDQREPLITSLRATTFTKGRKNRLISKTKGQKKRANLQKQKEIRPNFH